MLFIVHSCVFSDVELLECRSDGQTDIKYISINVALSESHIVAALFMRIALISDYKYTSCM